LYAIGKNTNTTEKNQALLQASEEVDLEVNAEKTKYMVVSYQKMQDIIIYC